MIELHYILKGIVMDPKWFKRLTHGAYLSRDYVEDRSFIEMIMSDYHEPYAKKIKAIEF